jgi:hypothetical protein
VGEPTVPILTHLIGISAEKHGEDTVLLDIAEDSLGCGVRV